MRGQRKVAPESTLSPIRRSHKRPVAAFLDISARDRRRGLALLANAGVNVRPNRNVNPQ